MLVVKYLQDRLDRIDVAEKNKAFSDIRRISTAVNSGIKLGYRQEYLLISIVEEIYCGVVDHNPLVVATWINSCTSHR